MCTNANTYSFISDRCAEPHGPIILCMYVAAQANGGGPRACSPAPALASVDSAGPAERFVV